MDELNEQLRAAMPFETDLFDADERRVARVTQTQAILS